MRLSRLLLFTIPVIVVVGLLSIGAASGDLDAAASFVLVGVMLGVAANRQVRMQERVGWAIGVLASIMLLDRSGSEGQISTAVAVAVALIVIAGVFVRWFQVGVRDASADTIDDRSTPGRSPTGV